MCPARIPAGRSTDVPWLARPSWPPDRCPVPRGCHRGRAVLAAQRPSGCRRGGRASRAMEPVSGPGRQRGRDRWRGSLGRVGRDPRQGRPGRRPGWPGARLCDCFRRHRQPQGELAAPGPATRRQPAAGQWIRRARLARRRHLEWRPSSRGWHAGASGPGRRRRRLTLLGYRRERMGGGQAGRGATGRLVARTAARRSRPEWPGHQRQPRRHLGTAAADPRRASCRPDTRADTRANRRAYGRTHAGAHRSPDPAADTRAHRGTHTRADTPADTRAHTGAHRGPDPAADTRAHRRAHRGTHTRAHRAPDPAADTRAHRRSHRRTHTRAHRAPDPAAHGIHRPPSQRPGNSHRAPA